MKTVPLILPENPSGFRSIPSTEQRLESVERKIDQVVAKLDMILDSMTKPTQEAKTKAFVDQWVKNPPSFGPSRPAALDVDDSHCSLKMTTGSEEQPPAPVEGEFTFSVPKAIRAGDYGRLKQSETAVFKQPAQSVEQGPKRMSGLPAKQQIEQWIARNFQTIIYFRRAAQFGLVTAKIEAKSVKADSTHKYTHRVKIKSTVMPGSFNPTIFGIDEAREVVAYLESLGVNVNTSALDNK